MKQEIYSKIKEYVTARKEDITRDLFSLVRIPSVKSEALPGAPFGKECRQALDAALALFAREGFETRCCADGKYGLAYYGEGQGDVGIFSHTDVVGVGDDWVFTKPFSPIAMGDALLGRGVDDNKNAVVGALYTLMALRDLGITPKHRIVVFLGAEEESGMEDIAAFVKEQPMPLLSFVPDNGYPLCIGEKSILRLWVFSDAPFRSVCALSGGVAFNVVLDQLVMVLAEDEETYAYLEAQALEKTALSVVKEEAGIRFTVRGRTAHASIPEAAINALEIGCSVLKDCPGLPEGDRQIFASAAHFLSDCNGEALGIAKEDPVFGKVTVANGMVAMQNGCLGFSLDIRYGARRDDEALLKDLTAACEKRGFSCGEADLDKGTLVDPDSPLTQKLLSVFQNVTGILDAKPYLSGGGTYARKLQNAFSLGTSTKRYPENLAMPAGHGGAHQSDEVISLEGFLDSIAVNGAMLLEGDALV